MSVWNEIEEALTRWEIPLQVNPVERYFIQEALAIFVREHVATRSVWDLLEAATKVVPGLDPSEADLLKKQWNDIADKPVVAKPGHHGMVVAMDARAWHTVLRQLQTQRDYFAGQMKGRGNIDNLIKKIQNVVGNASEFTDDPDLSGDPSDATPFTSSTNTGFNDHEGGEFPSRPMGGVGRPIEEPSTPFSARREKEREFSPEELGGTFADSPEDQRISARERAAGAPKDRFAHLAPAGSKQAASQAQQIKKKLQPGDKKAIGTGIGRMKVR